MPRFVGHYIGISFQAELLGMTLVGLLNSTLDWYPFDWTHQVKKIWELTLSQHYFLFYTDFEYWIKSILTWIVITRKVVAYIYTFLYMINFYPILTWSRPNLLLPWLILSFFQNFFLKSIVIMVFLWLWGGERFSLIRTLEFFLVEFLSLITSAYVWYAIACSFIQLKRIEKIRRIRKALLAKYSISYDLFASDGSSMEISKESSYGSTLGPRRHMSVPNLNEAFYRSIFSDNYNDNKLSRSLTTLSTINSFSDSEGFISQIVHNADLTPAEKCMKLLGITDVDVINARARVHKRMLASAYPHIKDNYATIRPTGSRPIRPPSIVDYLMTKTGISRTVFRMDDDRRPEITFEKVDRKEKYAIGQQEREIESFTPDTETADRKTEEESFIRAEKTQILESEMEKEFKCPQEPAMVDSGSDRIDGKEETKLQFVEKKKKKKVCPPMKELIETRPCFPLVGKRKFKECPFKQESVPSCSPFPCFSARRNKQLNNTNTFTQTSNVTCQAESNDATFLENLSKEDRDVNNEREHKNTFLESESSINVTTMQKVTNKGSENDLTTKKSDVKIPKLSDVPKELCLEPRRNFNYIFNNRSTVLPLANVWSTMGYLPFRQKFNFSSLYGREWHFNKTLFESTSSQELFDRGRLIAWKASNTELLLKVPEQVVCYTGVEYNPVSVPGTSNGTGFVKDKLEKLDSVDRESINTHRYASIEYSESKEKFEDDDDDPFYVYQDALTGPRNFIEDHVDDHKTTISTQTTDSIDNYNRLIVRLVGNTNSYVMYDTDNTVYPKLVSEMCSASTLDRPFDIKNGLKDNSYSNVSREDSIENESCCCKNSHHRLLSESLIRVAHSLEKENSSYSNKPPAYPKKVKKESLHRLIGAKNKITKVSFESSKRLEHYDRSRHDVESPKKKKRVMSSMEREQLEMKALRAYNQITLFEDKREMAEKNRRMSETIYCFVDDTRSLRNKQVTKNQLQEKNDAEMTDSFFEYITNFSNENVSKDKYNIDLSKREPSCSRFPNIRNKDAAIMLNLLDRHGSHWFKEELKRILAIKKSQVNVKHNESSRYISKLDKFLTSCQKIDDVHDGRELGRSHGKENISVSFEVPLSYNYLRTRSEFDGNRNVTNGTRDMILNSMESVISEVPITSIDLKDSTEFTENDEVKGEKETSNLPKEDDSKNTDVNIQINNLSHPSTNTVSPSTCPRRHQDVTESTDGFNHHEEVRRRNMSLHMINIARNIGWSLRPNGIVLTNKNLQGHSLESTSHRGSQQRDIIDDTTASMVHAAFSHKPEIIIRTFPRSSRSTTDQTNTDEYPASIFDDIYNTYRLMSTIDEFVLRANNEISISMGDELTLLDIRESEAEIDNLDDILPSSNNSMETERNFDISIEVIKNDDSSLESISTSADSLLGDEVVERDDNVEIVDRSSGTRRMDIADPRIDSLDEEATNDAYQPSLELIVAFFSFLIAYYVEYLKSYLFSLSDSSSSFYAYRPCEVHSESAFKRNVSERSLLEKKDELVLPNSANNANGTESDVQAENEGGIGVIEFSNEVDNENEVSVESTNQPDPSLHDSFDTMYSQSTAEFENEISVGEGSSMEEFP